ncbi:hypothetical protein HYV49_06350 [Candidatus Pacearchaeota archaeon]|nr:hypothetical protein [Candidatus Pacearchaeota archaeon]
MKCLIFDSSSIINLALNGLTDLLVKLKKIFGGKFIISSHVKYEVIDHPLKIREFKLNALKIKKLIDSKIIEFPESISLSKLDIEKKINEIIREVNHAYTADVPISLVHQGEASCLAISLLLTEKNIDNAIVIDERTTRLIVEMPINLKKLLEKKLHTNINLDEKHISKYKNIKIIRTPEILFVAYKNNLLDIENKEDLDAYLYAAKIKGTSIAEEEIKEIESMG